LPVSVDDDDRQGAARSRDRGQVDGSSRLADPALEIRDDDVHRRRVY